MTKLAEMLGYDDDADVRRALARGELTFDDMQRAAVMLEWLNDKSDGDKVRDWPRYCKTNNEREVVAYALERSMALMPAVYRAGMHATATVTKGPRKAELW